MSMLRTEAFLFFGLATPMPTKKLTMMSVAAISMYVRKPSAEPRALEKEGHTSSSVAISTW